MTNREVMRSEATLLALDRQGDFNKGITFVACPQIKQYVQVID